MGEASTRDRIVTGALRLFAQQGYGGTSISEIEAAAGLSPGSGALYTHFRSKQEVLAAAVEHSVALAESGYSLFPMLPLGDLRAELTLIVRGSLLVMSTWRDLIRVLLKESEQFPDVSAQAHDRIFNRAHQWFADWLAAKAKAGEIAEADFEVLAALWLGAVNQYWITSHLLGGAPAGLDEERFVTGWVDALLKVLEPATGGSR